MIISLSFHSEIWPVLSRPNYRLQQLYHSEEWSPKQFMWFLIASLESKLLIESNGSCQKRGRAEKHALKALHNGDLLNGLE